MEYIGSIKLTIFYITETNLIYQNHKYIHTPPLLIMHRAVKIGQNKKESRRKSLNYSLTLWVRADLSLWPFHIYIKTFPSGDSCLDTSDNLIWIQCVYIRVCTCTCVYKTNLYSEYLSSNVQIEGRFFKVNNTMTIPYFPKRLSLCIPNDVELKLLIKATKNKKMVSTLTKSKDNF